MPLVSDIDGFKPYYLSNAPKLRKVLCQIGRPYRCEDCGQDGFWNGKPLNLNVDHADGDKLNNTKANLRFMCPNCHSQTHTFSRVNSKAKGPPEKKRAYEPFPSDAEIVAVCATMEEPTINSVLGSFGKHVSSTHYRVKLMTTCERLGIALWQNGAPMQSGSKIDPHAASDCGQLLTLPFGDVDVQGLPEEVVPELLPPTQAP